MFLSTLFSLPADVSLADVCLEQETLTLVLKAGQTSAACPACTHPSTRIPGRYTRTLADVPCQGRAVRMRLEVRRRAKRLAMPTSRETLLRLIRSTAVAQRKTPQVLGLDDFAWKKGDRYGTLLVDLQAHCPVEVLPDREAATVVRGPRAHRGVQIISRDRAGAYAEAATRGAPHRRLLDTFQRKEGLRAKDP